MPNITEQQKQNIRLDILFQSATIGDMKGDSMKRKSIKYYLDELVDSVQDLDTHCGTTNGHIDREKMKRYKRARSDIRKYIIGLQKKIIT